MTSASVIGEDGIVRCNHGEPAIILKSRTDANPNRDFYKCPRIRDQKCTFFYWVDEAHRPHTQANNPTGAVTSPVNHTKMAQSQSSPPLSYAGPSEGPYTPQTPQRYNQALAPQAFPSTPLKRKGTDVDAGSPSAQDTANKKARLEAIKAGLKARNEDTQQSQHALPDLQQQEQEQDGETEPEPSQPAPRQYKSFLGLPESTTASEPSTPKRATSASNVDSTALPTPPQTSQHRAGRTLNVDDQRPEPSTPTRNKGKERAYPRFDRYVEQEHENPFVDHHSSEDVTDKDALPDFSSTQESSSELPTTAELINTSVTGMSECMQAFNTHFQTFLRMESVKHIERMERQKKALQLRDSAKRKHIAQLETENEALKEKLRKAEEENLANGATIATLKDKIVQLVAQRY